MSFPDADGLYMGNDDCLGPKNTFGLQCLVIMGAKSVEIHKHEGDTKMIA